MQAFLAEVAVGVVEPALLGAPMDDLADCELLAKVQDRLADNKNKAVEIDIDDL